MLTVHVHSHIYVNTYYFTTFNIVKIANMLITKEIMSYITD